MMPSLSATAPFTGAKAQREPDKQVSNRPGGGISQNGCPTSARTFSPTALSLARAQLRRVGKDFVESPELSRLATRSRACIPSAM